jgi:hypothetical protein
VYVSVVQKKDTAHTAGDYLVMGGVGEKMIGLLLPLK